MAQAIINPQELKKTEQNQQQLEKLRSWSKAASDARLKQEVLWYEIQLYKDGDHYVILPDRTATTSGAGLRVQPIKRRRGEIQRAVNKIRPMVRALKATTTATEIRYEVPGGSEDAIIASNYLNWFVDNYQGAGGESTANSFHDVIGDVTELGFTRGVGYFDIYWNAKRARPEMEARDPFDLLMDKHGRYAVRTYLLRKEDIKSAKDYDGQPLFKDVDLNSLTATSKQSASDVYNNYLTNKYQSTNPSNQDLAPVMVEEFHLVEEVEEPVAEGQASAGRMKTQVRIITAIQGQDKINAEEIDQDDEIRFIPFYPERSAEPWLKDALDPQKAANNIFTHMEEFMRTMGKGRIIKHKDVTIDRISDKDGQVVDYTGTPDRAPVFDGGLGNKPADFSFLNTSFRVIEDVIGLHPGEIQNQRVAKAIGYLLAQDEQNTSEPFRNLKAALTRVGQRLLKLANRHMMASQDIFWWENGQQTKASVIGNAPQVPAQVKQIGNVQGLTVDIIPRGAFAALAREEKGRELAQAGIITSPEVIMELMNIGNVRELVQKEMAYRASNPPPIAPAKPPTSQALPGNGLQDAVNSLKQEIYH